MADDRLVTILPNGMSVTTYDADYDSPLAAAADHRWLVRLLLVMNSLNTFPLPREKEE